MSDIRTVARDRFNLSRWAVTHQPLVLFLILVVALAGTLSYLRLGRAEDPSFTVKVMVVSAVWPGATAEEMQRQVADPIEKSLQELPHFEKVRTYSKPGQTFMQVQLEDSTPPGAVADLWYQVRLIRGDSDSLDALADHAHDLSDHLGDDHDLALLRDVVQRRRAAFADPGDKRHLLEGIDQRRAELQFAAISLGERIYADKPKRFTKGMERRWNAWRQREPAGA